MVLSHQGYRRIPLLLLVAIICLQKIHGLRLNPSSNINNFQWERSVDPFTGVASSKETSKLSPKSSLHKYISNNDNNKSTGEVVYKLFRDYPQWLVRGPVTFGLLRAIESNHNNAGGNNKDIETQLCVRLLGINILTFGKTSYQRIAITRQGTTTTQHCVKLPIKGGILALCPSENKNADMGHLRFTLMITQKTKSKVIEGVEKASTNNNEAISTIPTPSSSCGISLVTEIINYRPTIVGGVVKQETINSLRKWTYLSTQTILHGYVMWRFHNYCASHI